VSLNLDNRIVPLEELGHGIIESLSDEYTTISGNYDATGYSRPRRYPRSRRDSSSGTRRSWRI
jgi:hypothetical protein